VTDRSGNEILSLVLLAAGCPSIFDCPEPIIAGQKNAPRESGMLHCGKR